MSPKLMNGRNDIKDVNVEAVRSPTSSANSFKLVAIPWEDIIENGTVDNELSHNDKDTALINKTCEQKHVASQTSRKFYLL